MWDAEVQGGKAHAAKHSLPRLNAILQTLSPEQRPRLVRGDNAFGNEPVMSALMSALETLDQTYLFKLRQSPGVRRLIRTTIWRPSVRSIGIGPIARMALTS